MSTLLRQRCRSWGRHGPRQPPAVLENAASVNPISNAGAPAGGGLSVGPYALVRTRKMCFASSADESAALASPNRGVRFHLHNRRDPPYRDRIRRDEHRRRSQIVCQRSERHDLRRHSVILTRRYASLSAPRSRLSELGRLGLDIRPRAEREPPVLTRFSVDRQTPLEVASRRQRHRAMVDR